MTEKL